MKKILIISLILLFGCHTLDEFSAHKSLENIYDEYKLSYNTAEEPLFLNPQLWNTLAKARKVKMDGALTNPLALFPFEITNTINTMESIQGSSGCLVISGKDRNGTDLDYYLTFSLIREQWIISNVTIKFFLDGSERFLNKAVCNEQERMNIWLKQNS